MEINRDYIGLDSVNPLLTDFYQFSMIYAHWKNGRTKEPAVFDMYFRKCPFGLEYCIYGGVDECIEFLRNFKFTEQHINYLKTQFQNAEEEFFNYLSTMDMSDIKIYGFKNAEVVLPNEPLFTIEGTLDKVQLIETTFLNLTNYPTLISSLAMKLRLNPSHKNKIFIEDGSKYAQSSNGSVIGVKYAYIGGVDKTTNLLASKIFSLPMFANTPILNDDEFSFNSEEELELNGNCLNNQLNDILCQINCNKLKNQISKILYYALVTFKSEVFTFEIKNNENINDEIQIFKIVAFLINKNKGHSNHQSILILNYEESYEDIELVNQKLNSNIFEIESSNGDNVKYLLFIRYNPIFLKDNFSLKWELLDGIILGSEFLVSYTKPALGMVYKINQVNGKPCMKFSEDKEKQSIPGFKTIIRMYDNKDYSIGDFMCLREEVDRYINEKQFDAYLYNEFTQVHHLENSKLQIMNECIFDQGNSQYSLQLREKVFDNRKFYENKKMHLYISEGIRKIIIEEMIKLAEISSL